MFRRYNLARKKYPRLRIIPFYHIFVMGLNSYARLKQFVWFPSHFIYTPKIGNITEQYV